MDQKKNPEEILMAGGILDDYTMMHDDKGWWREGIKADERIIQTSTGVRVCRTMLKSLLGFDFDTSFQRLFDCQLKSKCTNILLA